MTENNLKVYSKEEVLKEALRFFLDDTLAARIWMDKYALKDLEGNYRELKPEDRFRTIANELARIDHKLNEWSVDYSDVYYEALVNGYIIPGGSNLYGIGNPYSFSSLGNCFVTGFEDQDSYGALMKLDEHLVQIMKRRGGVGADLGGPRPANTPVTNAAGKSSGGVSFASRYSNTTREVAQEGRK